MPLEATLVLLDNSHYAIDGDYTPTRYGAQVDAANIIFNAKTNSNPESVVGLMSSTSKSSSPVVLVTPTSDAGKIHAAMHGLNNQGEADLATSIQIAQLCLKHRQNKSQKQRIVAFVGSPLHTSESLTKSNSKEALAQLGKKLKKNNVAIDIVSIGEVDENQEALQALVEAANASDNCHLLVVPPSNDVLLSDVLLSSPILAEEAGAMGYGGGAGPSGSGQASGAAGASNDDGFGVDPNLDPELAMALRMSLEDERARQAAASGQSQPASTVDPAPDAPTQHTALDAPQPDLQNTNSAPVSDDSTSLTPATAGMEVDDAVDDDQAIDEDEELQRALALSRGDTYDHDAAQDTTMDTGNEEEMDEEEEIRKAIELSLQGDSASKGNEGSDGHKS